MRSKWRAGAVKCGVKQLFVAERTSNSKQNDVNSLVCEQQHPSANPMKFYNFFSVETNGDIQTQKKSCTFMVCLAGNFVP
jgi:hypothetical protein